MKKETKTRLPLAPKPAPHPRKNHIKTTQNIPRLVRHPHSCTTKNAPKRKPANYRKKQRFLQFWHTALVKQETGVQSQNSANAEFWSFLPLQRETQCLWQNLVAKAAKAKLCATKHGIGGPRGLPWSPQGRGEGLRERGKLRVEKVGFPSPLSLPAFKKQIFASFLKAQFLLLFQRPIQDPSTRLRLGRDDRLWHLKSPDLSKAVSQSPEFSLR